MSHCIFSTKNSEGYAPWLARKCGVRGVFCELIVWAWFRFLPFVLFSMPCYIRMWYIECLQYSCMCVLYLGGQLDKLCFSVHSPSRNEMGLLVQDELTHWDRDKMAANFQTTCSNAFSWMKMYEFRLRFHWSLFLRGVQSTIFHLWFK